MAFEPKKFNELYEDMRVKTPPALTDFEVGSVTRTMYESFAYELGVLYHKNRNYETGILALECAVRGCTAEQSCPARGDCGPNDVAVDVVGLPLSVSTVYYYDIYASELAALSTPKKSYCSEALEIADIIEASEYDADPNIAADIVVVGNICRSLETGISINDLITTPDATVMP